jgi:hypothetical protein
MDELVSSFALKFNLRRYDAGKQPRLAPPSAVIYHGRAMQVASMTSKDKPTFENVTFGPSNSRRLEVKYIFGRGLVFKCHIKTSVESAYGISGWGYHKMNRFQTLLSIAACGATLWVKAARSKASTQTLGASCGRSQLRWGGASRKLTNPGLNSRLVAAHETRIKCLEAIYFRARAQKSNSRFLSQKTPSHLMAFCHKMR